jgi:hypothetical protein
MVKDSIVVSHGYVASNMITVVNLEETDPLREQGFKYMCLDGTHRKTAMLEVSAF